MLQVTEPISLNFEPFIVNDHYAIYQPPKLIVVDQLALFAWVLFFDFRKVFAEISAQKVWVVPIL